MSELPGNLRPAGSPAPRPRRLPPAEPVAAPPAPPPPKLAPAPPAPRAMPAAPPALPPLPPLPGAGAVPLVPGSRRRTREFTSMDEPTAGLANPVFGELVGLRTPDGDFEVRTRLVDGQEVPGREDCAGLPLARAIGVRTCRGGPLVGYDAATDHYDMDGVPLGDPAPGDKVALPGGGCLTHWGRGYFSLVSDGGDSLGVFDRGGFLEFTGKLGRGRTLDDCQGLLTFRLGRRMPDGSEAPDLESFCRGWLVDRPARSGQVDGP